MTKKIHGVTVLYNPNISVLENIQSYISYLDVLYIIDNSEPVDSEIARQISDISKCIYINNGGNKGIAQALNAGAKYAIAADAAWLLTMDQDSRFEDNVFFKLCEFAVEQDEKATGIISPLHKTRMTPVSPREVDEVLTTMTSGNLVSLYAYQIINGFDEDYFIDAVDWDYCLRLNQAGFKVLRLNTVGLKHNLGNVTRHTAFSRKEVMVLNYDKIRRYYITRNKLVIVFKYWKHFPDFCYFTFKTLFRDLRHIILYEKNKLQKLKFMFKGIADYFLNRRGPLIK